MTPEELSLRKQLAEVKCVANELAQDAARWHAVRDGSFELLNNLIHTSNAEYRTRMVDVVRAHG